MDEHTKAFALFTVNIVIMAVFLGIILPSQPQCTYFAGHAICTEKYQNENGSFVIMDKNIYKIDNQLYKGILVGEMYHYSGNDKKITEISKYAEDSGL